MEERRLGRVLLWGLVLSAWFSSVFYGADLITAHRPLNVVPHMAWELRLPFLPWLAPVYLSVHILLGAAPLLLATRRELDALGLALCADVLVAGIGFILYPARLAFPSTPDPESWPAVFRFADWINGDFNLVPSLHVALSVTCVAVCARRMPGWCASALWLWPGAIGVSTLFLHQHHVIDVATGWLLGAASGRLSLPRVVPMNQSQV